MEQHSDYPASSPLPEGWSKLVSTTAWPGHAYYFNNISGESQWFHPAEVIRKRTRHQRSLSESDVDTVIVKKQIADELLMQKQPQQIARCDNCQRSALSAKSFDTDDMKTYFLLPYYELDEKEGLCVCPLSYRVFLLLSAMVSSTPSHSASASSDATDPTHHSPPEPIPATQIAQLDSCGSSLDSWDNVRLEAFNIDVQARATITLENYLQRLWKYARVSDATVVSALIYIIRLLRSGRIQLTPCNVFKFMLSALVASTKFFEDTHLCNKFLAVVCGVSVTEINCLEMDFLNLLSFNLNIKEDEFWAAVTLLNNPSIANYKEISSKFLSLSALYR